MLQHSKHYAHRNRLTSPARSSTFRSMSKVHILPCVCPHPFQDARYGNGKRVHNERGGAKKSTVPEARCTVCGAVRGVHAP